MHQGDSAGGTVGEKTREARLSWRKDNGCWYWEKDAEDGAARKEVTGRPEGRFMDAVREDMTVVEVTEVEAEDRTEWKLKIRCGNP